MLSPVRESFVCVGDQLEVTCTTDSENSLLEWSFTVPLTTMIMVPFRAINANSPSDQTSVINSTNFRITFSRISLADELPLISRLLINPVTTALNGTVVNCRAVSIMETASTTIYVLNRHMYSDGMSYYCIGG